MRVRLLRGPSFGPDAGRGDIYGISIAFAIHSVDRSVYGWCGGARCSVYGMGGGENRTLSVSIDIEDLYRD